MTVNMEAINYEVLEALNGLSIDEDFHKQVSTKDYLAIKRSIKKLKDETLLVQEAIEDKSKIYSLKDKEGKSKHTEKGILVAPENIEIFNKEIKELLNYSVEIPWGGVTYDQLEKWNIKYKQLDLLCEVFIFE